MFSAVSADDTSLLQTLKVGASSEIDAFTADLEAAVNAVKSEGSHDQMMLSLYRRASQAKSVAFVEKYSNAPVELKKHLVDAGLKSSKVMSLLQLLPESDRHALFVQFANANQDLIQDKTLTGKSYTQTEEACRRKPRRRTHAQMHERANGVDATITADSDQSSPADRAAAAAARAEAKSEARRLETDAERTAREEAKKGVEHRRRDKVTAKRYQREAEAAAARLANEADSSNTAEHRRRGQMQHGRRRGTGRRRGLAKGAANTEQFNKCMTRKETPRTNRYNRKHAADATVTVDAGSD